MNLPYIAKNLARNVVRGVAGDKAGKLELGMDRHANIKWETLDAIGRKMQAHPIDLAGATVVEIGPGKTPDLMISCGLAGAERVVGRDIDNRMPADWQSTERVQEVAKSIIGGSAPEFLAGLPNGTIDPDAMDSKKTLEHSAYDGMGIDLEGDSVDFLFSKSVFEHISRKATPDILNEHLRLLKSGGYALHIIDLRDHMFIDGDHVVRGNWLDILSYPEWLHNAMTSKRQAYVNRYRAREWDSLFRGTGFEIADWAVRRFNLPTDFDAAKQVHSSLYDPEEDYSIAWVEVLAKKP